MTFRLGLTGSIGMGKSTTAQLFVEQGCALWDADAAVHRLYSVGGVGVPRMAQAFPGSVVDGEVSRKRLKEIITRDPEALARIEAIIHPLVAYDREAFLAEQTAEITVLDIPLLFEAGIEGFDAVAVASAPAEIQRQRILARGTMSAAELDAVLARQLPDAEKRKRADYVIETDTLEHAREQVQAVVTDIRRRLGNA